MAIEALEKMMNGLTTSCKSAIPHPLAQLASHEIDVARQVVTKSRNGHLIMFRDIYLEEPIKAELVPFLEAEHSGGLNSDTPRPPRLARVQYDTVSEDGSHAYTESVIDVGAHEEVLHRVVERDCQPPLTLWVLQLSIGGIG
jgi:primary-amine oxidase